MNKHTWKWYLNYQFYLDDKIHCQIASALIFLTFKCGYVLRNSVSFLNSALRQNKLKPFIESQGSGIALEGNKER